MLRGETHTHVFAVGLYYRFPDRKFVGISILSANQNQLNSKESNCKQNIGKAAPSHATKACSGSKGTHPHILNLALEGSQWLTLGSDRFTPGKNTATH